MPSKAKSKPAKAAKKPAPKKVAPAKKAAKPAKNTAKPAAKKPAPKSAKSAPRTAKPAPKSKTKAVVKKAVVKKKPVAAANGASVRRTSRSKALKPGETTVRTIGRPVVLEKWTPPPEISRSVFNRKQHTRLLELKDSLMDSVSGMTNDQLRSRAEGGESSAFGMHTADAGADAYDRDFALSLLSKEQDALYEIEEALKRLDNGSYGTCEMCGKPIPQARLEALPFARYTIDCQGEYEREPSLANGRRPVRSLFGLMGDEEEDEDGEEKETVDKSED